LNPPRSKPPGKLYSQLAGLLWGILESSGEAVKQPENRSVMQEIKRKEMVFIKIEL